ncbi:branched-chain amino acid transport system II carrier protein [Aurantibacter sp.]|uniref:branched-chain amino acid transport system II carrier protein n=1 Tax=Aurantibacter sp. TaxID=2807103 RepID=UPI0035C7967F
MNKTKEILITGFALFSMFFGAGNLILPPFLGVQASENWWLVTLGFITTAVVIPILAILAHAKLQGSLFDFAKKVSPLFASIYCFIIYVICVLLPAPRTASVTHEMSIQPYFETSALLTSSIYFILVLVFVLNRSRILSLMGKFLTPIIVVILLTIICVGLFTSPEFINPSTFKTPFVSGILEGYQTFDAIGGAVVGGVIVISLRLKGFSSFESKKEIITKSGLIAGSGLLIIYAGLIALGAVFNSLIPKYATRIEILTQLSTSTLGQMGTTFLSVLVALACFTTAVGIITGVADYFKGFFNDSDLVYKIVAVLGCVFGVLIGKFDVHFIIEIAIPILMIIYPVTIVLIILNVLPDKYTSRIVFKAVVVTAMLFSIPDAFPLDFNSSNVIISLIEKIPLIKENLAWVLPSILVFVLANLKKKLI